jgi:hypothetical protein
MRRVALVVFVAAAAACSHQAPVGVPDDPRPDGNHGGLHADPFPWSEKRRLSWSDFLGTPDFASDASAMTAYAISYEATCEGPTFTFHVSNTFQPERSWVKPTLLLRMTIERLTLQHEQTHFDLGEVHARQMRQAMRELKAPCERPEDERRAIAERVMREDGTVQRRYDHETEFGVNLARQREWETSVARQLKTLKAFAE